MASSVLLLPMLCVAVSSMLFLAAAALVIAHFLTRPQTAERHASGGRWLSFAAGLAVAVVAVAALGLVGMTSLVVVRSESEQGATLYDGDVHHSMVSDLTPLASPPRVFQTRTSVGMILLLLAVGCVGFIGLRMALQSKSTMESALRTSPRPGIRVAAICSSGVVLLVGLALVGITRVRAARQAELWQAESLKHMQKQQAVLESSRTEQARHVAGSQLQRLPVENQPGNSLVRLSDDPADAATAVAAVRDPLPQDDRTTANEPTPDWLATGRHVFDGQELLVIASQQFATEGEARHDADAQVAELLTTDLAQFTRAPLGPRRSPVTGTDVHRAVREEFMQSVQRDFGTFFAPMYRVWYKVELSPAVREPYLVGWRAQLVESRTLTVVSGFAALLLAPLGVLFAAAARRATGGAGRGVIDLTALVGVLALWGVGAWVLNQSVVLWN